MEMVMTEKEYRALTIDSYSSIKVFCDDRKQYYRKFILGQPSDSDPAQEDENLRMGSLVDCLLFTPDEADDRYIITGAKIPSGQMLTFVNNMYSRTIFNTDENGRLTKTIGELITDAYHDTKYDRNGEMIAFKKMTLEKLKEEFLLKKIGYEYYIELRDRKGKVVITDDELRRANEIVRNLKTHRHTRDIVNLKSEGSIRVLDQHIMLGNYRGLDVKAMADRVIINEDTKTITPYDLKTTWNVELFDQNYLRYRYYLQCALYTSLLRMEFPEYTVRPMGFIVTDKFLYMDPLLYRTTEENLQQGFEGFEHKGVHYTGLDKAVSDILYHKESRVWTTSADLQKSGGINYIKVF